MKTIFTKLLTSFDFIAHPASGWFSRPASATAEKRRTAKGTYTVVLSPECYNLRGGGSKKTAARYNPAP